jgi:hypothetical protein
MRGGDCMRHFCGCDKGTRSVPATAKMWVELSVGGVADLAKRNPGGRRPERIQSCYAQF